MVVVTVGAKRSGIMPNRSTLPHPLVLSFYMLAWFLPSPYLYALSLQSSCIFHPHVLQLCVVVMVVPSPHPSSFLSRCFSRSAAAWPTRTPGMRCVLLTNTTPSFRVLIVVPRMP